MVFLSITTVIEIRKITILSGNESVRSVKFALITFFVLFVFRFFVSAASFVQTANIFAKDQYLNNPFIFELCVIFFWVLFVTVPLILLFHIH